MIDPAFPARPMNRHQRRRALRDLRREYRALGTTPEIVRKRLRSIPFLGALPVSTRPSESTVFSSYGDLMPADCAVLCRKVVGDPKRDRFVALAFERPPVSISFLPEHVIPAPLVIIERTWRAEGNHGLADSLLRCPEDSGAVVFFYGRDDVDVRYASAALEGVGGCA